MGWWRRTEIPRMATFIRCSPKFNARYFLIRIHYSFMNWTFRLYINSNCYNFMINWSTILFSRLDRASKWRAIQTEVAWWARNERKSTDCLGWRKRTGISTKVYQSKASIWNIEKKYNLYKYQKHPLEIFRWFFFIFLSFHIWSLEKGSY